MKKRFIFTCRKCPHLWLTRAPKAPKYCPKCHQPNPKKKRRLA